MQQVLHFCAVPCPRPMRARHNCLQACMQSCATFHIETQLARFSTVKPTECEPKVMSSSCRRANFGTHSRRARGVTSHHLRALHQQASGTKPDVDEDVEKPLIVLIGWLGAKERHFNKYVQLWQQMGHDTFGYRPPTPSIVLPPIGTAKAAQFIQSVQSIQLANTDQPVIYHIFSNAGFLFFGTVLRAIAAADRQRTLSADPTLQQVMLQPVQGLILDSAPCRLTPDISARGFTAAVLSKPAESIKQQHPQLVSMAQLLFTPVLKFPPIGNRQNQIWQAWEATAPMCPQLYLYSSADALIPPSQVQHFQKLQQSRGIDIHSKMWTDSAHCEHYRQHPVEYMKHLRQFVDACGSRHMPNKL